VYELSAVGYVFGGGAEGGGPGPVKYGKFQFKEGVGCLECNGTGYHGRTAIHELLDLSTRFAI
jgi:type IV pilus assembly protein PilB